MLTTHGNTLAALFVAALLLVAALCGDLGCVGCGGSCFSQTPVADFLRRLLVGVTSAAGGAVAGTPLMRPVATALLAASTPRSPASRLGAPLRI